SLATLHLFSVILFQSFCLSVFTVHRHLHSFPTRRSSDLPSSTGTSTSVQYSPKAASICRSEIRRGYVRVLTSTHCSPSTIRGSRSEEHTSELQSRFDLVCRLLLEKKKRRGKVTVADTLAA